MSRVSFPRPLEGALDALVVGALIAATVLAVHHEPNWNFASRDTLVYAIAADLWSRGEVPYRDFIDHKPPAAYLVYRGFFFFGGRSPRALWQGMTCLAGIGSLFLYLGLRLTGRTAAAVAAALSFFLLVVTDALNLGIESRNNCETIAVFWGMVSLSWALAYERFGRFFFAVLAGSSFAMAVLSKQTAALWILPLAAQLATADWRRPRREWLRRGSLALFSFTAGGAVIVAVCLSYFAAQDALRPFYEWVYERNVAYAHPEAAPGLQFRWWMLKETWSWVLPKLTSRQGLPFAVSMALLLMGSLTRRGSLARLALLWCATGLVGASLGLGAHSHYVVLLFPGLALALGAALDWLFSFAPRPLRTAPVHLLVALALASVALAPSLVVLRQHLRASPSFAPRLLKHWPLHQLGREIAEAAAPDDRMLAFGDPFDPLFYSGLKPPGRYIYYPGPALQPDPQDFMRELRASEPRFICIGGDTYAPFLPTSPGVQGMLKTYLDEHYEPWRERPGPVKVFHRRATPRGGEIRADTRTTTSR